MADDDVDDMILFKEVLHDAKIAHELSWFKNGQLLLDALEERNENHPDVIFLDLNMPVLGGMDCLRAIRASENLSDLPVIIYSTSDLKEDIKATKDAGANGYLNKPNDYNELKKKLYALLVEGGLYDLLGNEQNFVI